MRVITVSCSTISRSVPGKMLPRSRNTRPRCSPDHPDVDVVGLWPASGTHARHQPHRAKPDVLVELAAELIRSPTANDVVGDLLGPADRAEEDGVVLADLGLPVLRHHPLVLLVIVPAREIEPVLSHPKPNFLGRRLEHAHAFRHDLLSDAVAWNDGAVPAATNVFTEDARSFGVFWRIGDELVGHLPPKPRLCARAGQASRPRSLRWRASCASAFCAPGCRSGLCGRHPRFRPLRARRRAGRGRRPCRAGPRAIARSARRRCRASVARQGRHGD